MTASEESDRRDADWRPASAGFLAAAYGAVYAVFALLTHGTAQHTLDLARSEALLSAATGFLLPATVLLFLVARRTDAPWSTLFQPAYLASGIAATLIAGSTLLAFSWADVSVLVALLLMRGGVLCLSPALDLRHRDGISALQLTAVALSLGAVGIAILGQEQPSLPRALVLTLAVYLAAYALRLQLINLRAKRPRRGVRAEYARNELTWVLMLVLILVGLGRTGLGLSDLFAPKEFYSSGALYSLVLALGTLLYLDPRENSFSIVLNRGASVIGVLAATVMLAVLDLRAAPTTSDIGGAVLILLALTLLARHDRRRRKAPQSMR